MIHFDVSHIVKTQSQSDELRNHLDGRWFALALGTANTPTANQISAVIYKDEEDVTDRGSWLLIKYPDARQIHKK